VIVCPGTCCIDGCIAAEMAEWRSKRAERARTPDAVLHIPVGVGQFVYLVRDAAGDLLYVGRTTNPLQRFANHSAGRRTRSLWIEHARSIDWEQYDDASDAEWRERELIEDLQPPHNVIGTVRPSRPARRGRRRHRPDARLRMLVDAPVLGDLRRAVDRGFQFDALCDALEARP
jgi:predicted GIY-YIG superfamily endonuclease